MVNELQIINTGQSILKENTSLQSVQSRVENVSLDLTASDEDISAAISKGDIDKIHKYLASGGNPNFYNRRNHSLLECAFAAKNQEVIAILIKCGAGTIFELLNYVIISNF